MGNDIDSAIGINSNEHVGMKSRAIRGLFYVRESQQGTRA
jgi:hypothetical protein